MKLALLFWFYKEFRICRGRLRLLRRLNPGVAIFGLYGGPVGDAENARRRLGPLLDDFYAYAGEEDAPWKWRHGDLLVAAWHRHRGHALAWDTVVLVQWDMLLLRPVSELLAKLTPGEALFSGFRPAAEVSAWWGWLKGEDPEKRADRDRFVAFLREQQGYTGELWCCLFIVVCLPRRLLDLYLASGPPEAGFLEYKLPTLAVCWGVPVCRSHPFEPWWASNPATHHAPRAARILNAVGDELDLRTALEEVASNRGPGILHPYRSRFPAWLARPALARPVLAGLQLAQGRRA